MVVWYAATMPKRPPRKRPPLDPADVSPIERGVPLPGPPNGVLRRYPFAEMEPGDSFTVPADRLLSARAAASRFKAKYPKRGFVSRIEGERARIWRVK
jgi:hypothetical protein